MIEIPYAVFWLLLFAAAVFGFWVATTIAYGFIKKIEEANNFFHEMLIIKEREIMKLEREVNGKLETNN